MFYQDPEFKEWMKQQEFDLVIMDSFGRECALPLAHKWGAKSILFSPTPFMPWEADALGFPTESSFGVNFEREWNFLLDSVTLQFMSLKWYFWRKFQLLPRFDELVKKDLGLAEAPTVHHMEKDVPLYFLNSHYSSEFPRSLPPFVVQVGGMHCKETNGIKDKVRKLPSQFTINPG